MKTRITCEEMLELNKRGQYEDRPAFTFSAKHGFFEPGEGGYHQFLLDCYIREFRLNNVEHLGLELPDKPNETEAGIIKSQLKKLLNVDNDKIVDDFIAAHSQGIAGFIPFVLGLSVDSGSDIIIKQPLMANFITTYQNGKLLLHVPYNEFPLFSLTNYKEVGSLRGNVECVYELINKNGKHGYQLLYIETDNKDIENAIRGGSLTQNNLEQYLKPAVPDKGKEEAPPAAKVIPEMEAVVAEPDLQIVDRAIQSLLSLAVLADHGKAKKSEFQNHIKNIVEFYDYATNLVGGVVGGDELMPKLIELIELNYRGYTLNFDPNDLQDLIYKYTSDKINEIGVDDAGKAAFSLTFLLSGLIGYSDQHPQATGELIEYNDDDAQTETSSEELEPDDQNDELIAGHYRFTGDKPSAVTVSGSNVYMHEVIGKRPTQEDAMITFAAPDFDRLSEADTRAVFNDTVKTIQARHGEVEGVGSTMVGTVAWNDKGTIVTRTASLGDSLSYLIVVNDKGEFVADKSRQLNSYLHNLDNPAEEARIRQGISRGVDETRYIYNGRVHGLAVTGALGDKDIESYGLTHAPHCDDVSVKLNQDEHAFVVVACDGLTEQDKRNQMPGLTLEEIGTMVANGHRQPESLPESLINAALSNEITARKKHPSYDNISVAVLPVTSSRPVGVFVFDGHGGDQVSNAAANDFKAEFTKSLRHLERNKQQQADLLRSASDEYLAHLKKEIYNELLDSKIGIKKFGTADSAGRLHFDIKKVLKHPSRKVDDRITTLRFNNSSLDLAIKKYYAVSEMAKALRNKDGSPVSSLEDFKTKFEQHRSLIETRRDSAAIKFLKFVVDALSFGIASMAGLWKVKGKEEAKKISDILDGKTPRPKKS